MSADVAAGATPYDVLWCPPRLDRSPSRAIHRLDTRSFGARSLFGVTAVDGRYDDCAVCPHIHDGGPGSKESQLHNADNPHFVYEICARGSGSLLGGQ